jgi:outer membrane immunogenic protein
MRRISYALLAATALSFGLAQSASAADLPARVYTKAPIAVAPAWSWTGFYLGGNVGYGFGRVRGGGATTEPDGIVGGGQLGYNWQTNNFVFGIETDFQGADERDSVSLGTVPASTATDRLNWFGTVRGRVGVVGWNNWLFYATGGYAYGEVETTVASAVASASARGTQSGYTLGGGIEGVIAPNWTAKVEYLYVDFDRFNQNVGLVTVSRRADNNIIRAGLNYHFNLGGGY